MSRHLGPFIQLTRIRSFLFPPNSGRNQFFHAYTRSSLDFLLSVASLPISSPVKTREDAPCELSPPRPINFNLFSYLQPRRDSFFLSSLPREESPCSFSDVDRIKNVACRKSDCRIIALIQILEKV